MLTLDQIKEISQTIISTQFAPKYFKYEPADFEEPDRIFIASTLFLI